MERERGKDNHRQRKEREREIPCKKLKSRVVKWFFLIHFGFFLKMKEFKHRKLQILYFFWVLKTSVLIWGCALKIEKKLE